MNTTTPHHLAIVGAGPAGLMAAEAAIAAHDNLRVTVYDAMPSVGRKFLLAGRGGLNLTHTEPLDPFLARYRTARPDMTRHIAAFTPDQLRAWCEDLGQPTFVGSSGRVFPKAMKASGVLRAWLRRLDATGRISVETRHRWVGWEENHALKFETPEGDRIIRADATVLALGGASWPRLGSDGAWLAELLDQGVPCRPLVPANCGFHVSWSEHFRSRFAGQPLKGVAIRQVIETAQTTTPDNGSGLDPDLSAHVQAMASVRGDIMVTNWGLEGQAIYALSADLRDAIDTHGSAKLLIDLKPDASPAQLSAKFARQPAKQSLSNRLRRAFSLPPAATGLLHEHAALAGRRLADYSPDEIATLLKGVPVPLDAAAGLDRAISSAGGVTFDGVDDQLMLHTRPGVFIAGEMLDWEAPTGGYLLQACFATGATAGRAAAQWVASLTSPEENTRAVDAT